MLLLGSRPFNGPFRHPKDIVQLLMPKYPSWPKTHKDVLFRLAVCDLIIKYRGG